MKTLPLMLVVATFAILRQLSLFIRQPKDRRARHGRYLGTTLTKRASDLPGPNVILFYTVGILCRACCTGMKWPLTPADSITRQ
jgi:hypothetical protein